MKRGKQIVICICAILLLLLGIGNFCTHSAKVVSASIPTKQVEWQSNMPLFPPIQVSEFSLLVNSAPCSIRHFSHHFSVYSIDKQTQLHFALIRFIQQTIHLQLGLLVTDIIFPFQYFW